MRIAEDSHSRNLVELVRTEREQLVLIFHDIIQTYSLDIIERCCQSHSTDEVWRTRLKLVRQFVESCTFERHCLDHLATSLVWRHLFEPFTLAIEHTYTCRTIDLMAREDEEVTIEGLNIHLQVWNGLCAIHKDRYIPAMREINNHLDGIDGSQHIRHMRQANQSCALGEKTSKMLQVQFLKLVKASMTDDYTLTCLKQLPTDDIGVMFHIGDNHLIALVQECLTKRICHKIDALCGSTSENDLGALTGKGYAGGMKRWNFRGLEASHGGYKREYPIRMLRKAEHEAVLMESTPEPS